jgi:hypothetical protein
LIKAGIAGAREAEPSARITLHLACGGQNAESRWFLDEMAAHGVAVDIIGQSYYPRWHGTFGDLKSNLTDLAERYKRPIIVAEYSVPNVKEINDIFLQLPAGKGLGTFIWDPPAGALFDRRGATEPEIDVRSGSALLVSLPPPLRSSRVLQVRGRLSGILVNSASFSRWFLRLLKAQRFLKNKTPVFLDLGPQVQVVHESLPIAEQPAPRSLLVQFESQYPQVAQVFLLFTRELADENVILVDDKNAKPSEVAEPLLAVFPVGR